MKDIYVIVPKGTRVYGAADDHDLADMQLANYSAEQQDTMEVVNTNLLEIGED